ncbi:MAG TPA: zinc metallopeptidase [Planctomycetes bacterium]|nr:zinc metallopeptidase [Planctomycetota bacterium]
MPDFIAFLFFDPRYFLFVGPFLLLAMWANWKVKGTFEKYNKGSLRSGLSGLEVARMILQASGLRDVKIESVPGMLMDHYDPQDRTVRLSQEILTGRTPSAVAVAAHECGHALQHAENYKPMEARASLVPIVGLGSRLAMPMFLIGMLLGGLRGSPLGAAALWVGVIGFGMAVLFHLVTLPVEFDASRRAFRILEGSGMVAADEMPAVKKVLYAAGFTYVAAALTALAELAYWLMLIMGGSGDD